MKKFLGYKTRSTWKGSYFKCNYLNNRNYIIKKKDINKELYIYNGKKLKYMYILSKFIGYKLGQLSLTKSIGSNIHIIKRKKKKNKNKSKNRGKNK
jgi:ribosomal protein S19